MLPNALRTSNSILKKGQILISKLWNSGISVRILLLAFIMLLCIYPLIILLIASFRTEMPGVEGGVWGFKGWIQAYTDPQFAKALFNTLVIAISKTLIAGILCIFVCWTLTRSNVPGRRLLDLLARIKFYLLPPLPTIIGWILLLAPKTGFINVWWMNLTHGGPLFNLFSMAGVLFLLVSGSISMYYVFLAPSFSAMDTNLEDAAKMSGASPLRTVIKITLPLLKPGITSMIMLSFIVAMETFTIILFVGGSNLETLATLIYSYLNREPTNYGAAMAAGCTLLFITISLVVLQWKLLGGRSFAVVTGKGYRPRAVDLRHWKWPISIVLWIIIGVITIPPVIMIITSSFLKVPGFYSLPEGAWTLNNWSKALHEPQLLGSISNTMILSIAAPLVAMLLCTIIAYITSRTKFIERKILDLITWIPNAVPSVVMSLAYLFAWIYIKPFGYTLYGTVGLLILVLITTSLPLGVRVMGSVISQIHPELEESARVAGASWKQSMVSIWFPLLKKGMSTIFLMQFAFTVRTFESVILLVGPKNVIIGTLIFQYWGEGRQSPAIVLGIIQALIIAACYLLVWFFGRKRGIKTER